MKRKSQYFKFVIVYNLILLILFLVVSLSVLNLFKQHQYEKVKDEAQMTFEREDDFFKHQITAIRNVSEQCRFNKLYNELYVDTPNVYLDIGDNLKEQKDKIPVVDSIYLYDKKNRIVVSSVGVFSEELFFDKICKMETDIFEDDKNLGGGV